MSEDEEISCPICNHQSESEQGMKVHCGIKHSNKNNPYKIEKECDGCNSIFYVTKAEEKEGEGVYCSMKCRSNSNTIGVNCIECSTTFTVVKARYDKYNVKFCSKECQRKYNSFKKECDYCAELFSVKRSRVENGEGVYCSKECHKLDKSEQHICKNCGEKVRRPQCRNKQFCSFECFLEYSRVDNPDIRNSSEYDEWRIEVLERDNWCCIDCGKEKRLQTHHIVPVYDNVEKATEVENGVTVCVECHAQRHRNRGENHTALLIENVPDERTISKNED